MKKKILGVIPARFESTRFPGKPLAKILGKTLIQRTYENAKNCEDLDDLIVATDDQRIFDHVIAFGGKVVITSNCQTGTDRIAEVVLSNKEYNEYDTIINIQGDEPCIETDVISKVIDALDDQASMSTAVMKLENEADALDPSIVKCVFDKNGNAVYFSRALIPAGKTLTYKSNVDYYRHLGIYCFKRHFLLKFAALSETPLQLSEDLEQLKVLEHGYKIKVAIVHSTSIGVDTPEDIKKIETILCKQNSFL